MLFKVDASKIRTLMFERDINGVYALARLAQINAFTAAKVLKDGASASAKTIGALAKFFGCNGNDLILKE